MIFSSSYQKNSIVTTKIKDKGCSRYTTGMILTHGKGLEKLEEVNLHFLPEEDMCTTDYAPGTKKREDLSPTVPPSELTEGYQVTLR